MMWGQRSTWGHLRSQGSKLYFAKNAVLCPCSIGDNEQNHKTVPIVCFFFFFFHRKQNNAGLWNGVLWFLDWTFFVYLFVSSSSMWLLSQLFRLYNRGWSIWLWYVQIVLSNVHWRKNAEKVLCLVCLSGLPLSVNGAMHFVVRWPVMFQSCTVLQDKHPKDCFFSDPIGQRSPRGWNIWKRSILMGITCMLGLIFHCLSSFVLILFRPPQPGTVPFSTDRHVTISCFIALVSSLWNWLGHA